MAFLESRIEGEKLILALNGEWRAAAVVAIRGEFRQLELGAVREAQFDAAAAKLDLAGAWLLDDFTRVLAAKSIPVTFAGGEPQALQLVRSALYADAASKPTALREFGHDNPVEMLGRTAIERLQDVRA